MKDIIESLRKFNQERDWEQFHNGKDLALALSIEAAELNEAFLWKDAENVKIEVEASLNVGSVNLLRNSQTLNFEEYYFENENSGGKDFTLECYRDLFQRKIPLKAHVHRADDIRIDSIPYFRFDKSEKVRITKLFYIHLFLTTLDFRM